MTDTYLAYLERIDMMAQELDQVLRLCDQIAESPEMLAHQPQEWINMLRHADVVVTRLIECCPWGDGAHQEW